MRRYILISMRYWYVIMSMLLLWVFLYTFWQKLPDSLKNSNMSERSKVFFSQVLEDIKKINNNAIAAGIDTTLASGNPFDVSSGSGKSSAKHRKSAPLSVRNFKLTGILNQKLAMILDPQGTSHMAGVGDSIGSVQVVNISSQAVKLKDKAGTFELRLNE